MVYMLVVFGMLDGCVILIVFDVVVNEWIGESFYIVEV